MKSNYIYGNVYTRYLLILSVYMHLTYIYILNHRRTNVIKAFPSIQKFNEPTMINELLFAV